MDYKDKVALVTGGEAGIGKAIVNKLNSLSASVISMDIHSKEGRDPEGIDHITCDISNKEQVNNAIQKIIDNYGKIDILINNAGVARPQLLADTCADESQYEIDEASFQFLFDINVKGTVLCTQAVVKQFLENNIKGVIVNMSSEAGMEGSAGQSLYAATKGAINALTRSWAKELGSKGIRVVALAPGIIEKTDIRSDAFNQALAYVRHTTVDHLTPDYASSIPLGRPGYLNEIANLVAFLGSDDASYITGTIVNISGGKSRG
ncbi:MAG: sorbitol-6-phosphate dehydrogenase subunit [Eubacteriales bacterium]|nr:sorbitol-6-phosphate dehydrogenase subunit [Eubacteriales bacterium]